MLRRQGSLRPANCHCRLALSDCRAVQLAQQLHPFVEQLLQQVDHLTLCASLRCQRLARVERLIDVLIELTRPELAIGPFLRNLPNLRH